MATRAEQLAEAYLEVARVNHYMVGIVEPVTDDELAAAEQLLIGGQNALDRTSEARRYLRHELALDLVQAEQRKRLDAASRGTPAPEPESVHTLNLDCMALDDVAEVAEHLATLQAYARTKARAMALRLGGDVSRALTRERECERLYAMLPSAWRW